MITDLVHSHYHHTSFFEIEIFQIFYYLKISGNREEWFLNDTHEEK